MAKFKKKINFFPKIFMSELKDTYLTYLFI